MLVFSAINKAENTLAVPFKLQILFDTDAIFLGCMS